MSGQGTVAKSDWPGVRKITVSDLVEVIGAGLADFRRAPVYGLALGGLFAAAGWLILALLVRYELPYLAYPLAMGFALVAPFAAVGFYAVSEHLERDRSLSWSSVLGSVWSAAARDLRWMALVTGFALVIWMDIAAFLFFGLMGFNGFGPDFLDRLFTTPTGIAFVLLGNVSGALIAMAVFSISAVSFPMLYDRDVDFVTAMVTSVRLVVANPIPMIAWCVLIAILMLLSILSVFVGLFMTLPLVGHATWHLYRRAVEPAAAPTTGQAVA